MVEICQSDGSCVRFGGFRFGLASAASFGWGAGSAGVLSLAPSWGLSFFFVTVVVVGCLRACADAIPAVLADAIRSLDLSVSFISLLCVHSPSKMSKNSDIFGRTIFHLLLVILVTLASHLSSSVSCFAGRH